MKKTILIITSLVVIFGFQQCKFDLFTDMSLSNPTVEITSVKNINDTVYLKGVVTNEGQAEVTLTGFCYAEGQVPDAKDNQILFQNEGLQFEAVIPGLWPGKEYYFRAFAANSYAFSYSTAYHYIMESSKPPIVPCTLKDNVISFNGKQESISYKRIESTNPKYGGYEVETHCNSSFYLNFYFPEEPVNGIYTTVSGANNLTPGKKYVDIVFFDGNYYGVNENAYVYISNNGSSITISFCDLTIDYYGSTPEIKGKVIIN